MLFQSERPDCTERKAYKVLKILTKNIQVRVPYKVVGLVVGPKGATIKRIQQNTHTYIVTPSREKDPVFEVTGKTNDLLLTKLF